MAIEIIPRQEVRKILLVNILLYFALALILILVCSYFLFWYFEKKTSQSLEDLENQIVNMRNEEIKKEEDTVLKFQNKINDFSQLLNNHKPSVNFLNYLENICHPRVQFTNFSLDVKQLKMVLSGQAESFQALGQQILILKEADFVKDFHLLSIGIGKEGGAEFSLDLFLSPEVLSQ